MVRIRRLKGELSRKVIEERGILNGAEKQVDRDGTLKLMRNR